MRRLIPLLSLLLLAACAAETAVEPIATVPPTATIVMTVVETTAVPTHPPTPTDEPALAEPTQPPPTEPALTATAEIEADVVIEYGRTSEGAYYQGATDAPVTLIDYSDFL